jgi:hypothetical protein
MPTDFIGLFTLLAAARIRFLVVGGLALLLHGLDRLTAYVDLAIDLFTDAALETVRALTQAGYRSMAPVDVMLAPVVGFDDLWADAALTTIGGVGVRIASVRHLIVMKQAAGRPQDLVDLGRLAWLQAALQLAYQSGAIKPRRPDSAESLSADTKFP